MTESRLAKKIPNLEPSSSLLNQVSFLIYALAILGWIFGVHVTDIARIFGIILGGIFIFFRSKFIPFKPSCHWSKISILFILIYIFMIPFYLISKVKLGEAGLDFAIFSQAVDSISKYGVPYVSLINGEWKNMLYHHFAPILYVPGWVTFLGVPAYISISVVHTLTFASGLLGFYFFCRKLDFNSNESLIAVVWICLNPTIRHSIFWGVHDETFAFGFISLAYYSWLTCRPWYSLFSLLLICTIKESMFALVSMFCLMVWIDDFSKFGVRFKYQLPYLIGFMVGSFCFISYFFLQPIILEKTFDHMGKLANLSYMIEPRVISEKMIWIFSILFPVLFFPLWFPKQMLYLLPALPLIAMVMVSSFEPMWQIRNYYGVIPTFILYFSIMMLIRKMNFSVYLRNPIVWIAITLTHLMGDTLKPWPKIIQIFNHDQNLHSEKLASIVEGRKIVVSNSAAVYTFQSKILLRYEINPGKNLDFDYIIYRSKEEEYLNQSYRDISVPCDHFEDWVIRCPIS